MKLGKTLWEEDDALPHDRERVSDAFVRITGVRAEDLEPVERVDAGEGDLLRFDNGVIMFISYPGNSALYAVPGGEYDEAL